MKQTFFVVLIVFTWACSMPTVKSDYRSQIQLISDSLFLSEQNDDLSSFLKIMSDSIISMPEYQPMLVGIDQVTAYYTEIFKRQAITKYEHQTEEVIDLVNTQVEFGTFRKEYRSSEGDSIVTLDGKYCRVWSVKSNGLLLLKGEGFGYFHGVKGEGSFIVDIPDSIKATREVIAPEQTPLILRANNALMEKYVSGGKGELRAMFFTEDARVMPFAQTTFNGMAEIKPYLIKYDTHGPDFKIDTISVYTFHYETHGDYIVEYPRFYVLWSTPTIHGRAQGKGLRLWKRQPDNSFKLYREIGFHDYIQ